jgi:2-C-methyl-D-erythritol 4-phosphate cytidylyltransferase
MTKSTNRFIAIIPAAGRGSRMGDKSPKQYLLLAKKTLLEHALAPFLHHPAFTQVVVVVSAEDTVWPTLTCSRHPKVQTCIGAEERMLSVYNGLRALSETASAEDWICVHDAARCLLHPQDLASLLSQVESRQQGAILADKIQDTVKQCAASNDALLTIDRTPLWLAQTPQIFRYKNLLDAYIQVISQNKTITDEAQAIELLGLPTQLHQANYPNIKITRPGDLAYAKILLEQATLSVGEKDAH